MSERFKNGDVVEVLSQDNCIVEKVKIAKSWWSRARGLLGTLGLPTTNGLWLHPCSSIHMVGMAFSIDVVFLSDDLRVVKIKRRVRPFAVAIGGREASSALELTSNHDRLDSVSVGDKLEFRLIAG